MIQNIIAYAIIATAWIAIFIKAIRFFNLSGKNKKHSSKCGSCTAECALRDLHIPVKERCSTPDKIEIYL
jgi:hypothetical protein